MASGDELNTRIAERISDRITRRIAARVAHRATGQQDEATPRGMARRFANRADATTTRLVANVLDLFGADDKAQDFRTIAQGTEDTLADARTLPGKVASVAGYVAPQAAATVLGARGLAAAGQGAAALGAARTARAIQAVAGAKGAGVVRRNVGGAIAAAPLITVPGALSDDPNASTVGVLSQALPEDSMLGKAARTVASTKAGRLAADFGIDVLAGSALEGVGHGAGAAGRAVGARVGKALDVSEGMVEAGAKAAGDQVDEAATTQGRGFAQAADDERAAQTLAETTAARNAEKADALAKLEETKLNARHAAMERDALKAKPKALPPSPDEASRYDVETYKLNRDRNADLRAQVRATWEEGQERAAIADEPEPMADLTARTESGRLPKNLANAETDELARELLTLHEANSADEGIAQGSVRIRGNLNYADDTHAAPPMGDVGVHKTDAAVNASGRINSRAQAIARIEAELQSRGVEPSDAMWMASEGHAADGSTAFDFGANVKAEPAPAVTARVFHGTDAEPHQFADDRPTFFTSNPEDTFLNKRNVASAEVQLQRPLTLAEAARRAPEIEAAFREYGVAPDVAEETLRFIRNGDDPRAFFMMSPEVTKAYRSLGYDGAVVEQGLRNDAKWQVPFSPDRIKNVTWSARESLAPAPAVTPPTPSIKEGATLSPIGPRRVTAEDMLAMGKRRAAEVESGLHIRSAPDLRPAMEREGRMFGDLPSRGTMFDVGGAVGAGLKNRFGSSVVTGAAGAGLAQSDDEKIKATGTGLMALAAIHAVGLPRIKAGAGFVGNEAVAQMKQSPLGVKVLNSLSHDILADPEVKNLFSAYQDAVAKGRARAAELSKAAKALGPAGDRQVSDAIERESFEPLTGDQTAVLAVAQRISDEFTALGRGKVAEHLLSPATVAKREGQYLPRVYAEHLGESATDAAARVVKKTTAKPRIVGDKQRTDLSDDVRNRLGEVREASFRTAYGLDKGYRDIAAAKLFAGLREMPGVVHPEFASAADALLAARTSGDAGAIRAAKQQLDGLAKALERAGEGYKRLPDTPGMGILRGAVVRADVAAYMDGIPAWGGKMGDLYTYWKRVHTVMNPGTHVGNTMSNSVVAHMSGLPVWAQPKALKQALADYTAYGPTTKYLAELGILERGLPTIADAVPVGGRKMSDALTELSETTRPETKGVLAEHGITPRGKFRKGFDTVAHKMEAAYSKEDGVFRVATFTRLVAEGMEPRAAADYVDRAFVNYQTRSPLLGAIKNTVSPFILYPAKAIPFVAGQIVEHPWRWATLAAAWGAMDQYSQKKVGEIAQSDLRPDQRLNKRLGYLVPGFTQLPFTNEKGDRYGIDVARWTPFSALTGAPAPGSTAMALGGADVPAILQPSGPFLDIGARVVNTDPFTGQKLVKPGDDFMDKAATVVKGAASLALPSAASFHLPRVVGDLRNADPKAAAIDALGFVGAKPSVVRPGAQRTREQREYAAARANIIGDLRYDLQRAKSPERKRALEARAREKLLRLAGPMQELAGRK